MKYRFIIRIKIIVLQCSLVIEAICPYPSIAHIRRDHALVSLHYDPIISVVDQSVAGPVRRSVIINNKLQFNAPIGSLVNLNEGSCAVDNVDPGGGGGAA